MHEPIGGSTVPGLHGVAPPGATTNSELLLVIAPLMVIDTGELLVKVPACTFGCATVTAPCA